MVLVPSQVESLMERRRRVGACFECRRDSFEREARLDILLLVCDCYWMLQTLRLPLTWWRRWIGRAVQNALDLRLRVCQCTSCAPSVSMIASIHSQLNSSSGLVCAMVRGKLLYRLSPSRRTLTRRRRW